MGRRYSINGSVAVGTNETIVGVTSATTIRPKLYDVVISSGATAADNATIFHIERYTVAGTSTSFTPVALDPGDPAALAAGGVAHSTEPTYTADAILLKMSTNQRATVRWVAAPGSEFVAPATAANGLGLQNQTSTGVTVHEATFLYEE